MCLILYLATDTPSPLLAYRSETPEFHVRSDYDGIDDVTPQFTKPHCCYLGSHAGCGCGFRLSPDYSPTQPDPEQEKTHQQLCDYLETCLQSEPEVELYYCWAGDEKKPAQHQQTVTLAQFRFPEFCFLERQKTIVRR